MSTVILTHCTMMLSIVLHCINIMIVIIDDYCTSDWI